MFTVNQICEVLEVASIDQSTLFNVNEFANSIQRGAPRPVKKEVLTSNDRKYNLAVSAINILMPA